MEKNILFDALGCTCTNENLGAIILGLDLKPDDNVLAVGGCGDQAFAILEYASEVKAVDFHPAQVDFIKKRIAMLELGDMQRFLMNPKLKADAEFSMGSTMRKDEEINTGRRHAYFTYEGRFNKIRKKLSHLEVEEADILEVAVNEKGFTKVYLSNAISYNPSRFVNPTLVLSEIAANLPVGGLIYVADHDVISRDHGDIFLPDRVVIEEKLTKIAQKTKARQWSSAVYKVA
ncbi:MAG: hypothetical protein KAT43_02230 [Nanoarchaeota archaeon]|nr:hypothetical protein [Nanoarchaeota archaeon]